MVADSRIKIGVSPVSMQDQLLPQVQYYHAEYQHTLLITFRAGDQLLKCFTDAKFYRQPVLLQFIGIELLLYYCSTEITE